MIVTTLAIHFYKTFSICVCFQALDFGRKAEEFSQQCEPNSLSESIRSLIQQAETHLNPEQTLIVHH